MSRFVKFFAANTFGVTIAATGLCSAAVALSAPAAAEPAAPPAVPGIPALSMLQQFATNPASVGAVLQTAATALNGASEMIGAPAASTLPVSPIQGAPGTAPVADPAAGLPLGPGSTIIPLLNQLGVPASLANLAPTNLPLPLQVPPALPASPAYPALPASPAYPGLPASPAYPGLPATAPLTAPPAGTVPLLPVAPGNGGTAQMPLLNALP